MKKRKNFLKEAVVILIVSGLVLSSLIISALPITDNRGNAGLIVAGPPLRNQGVAEFKITSRNAENQKEWINFSVTVDYGMSGADKAKEIHTQLTKYSPEFFTATYNDGDDKITLEAEAGHEILRIEIDDDRTVQDIGKKLTSGISATAIAGTFKIEGTGTGGTVNVSIPPVFISVNTDGMTGIEIMNDITTQLMDEGIGAYLNNGEIIITDNLDNILFTGGNTDFGLSLSMSLFKNDPPAKPETPSGETHGKIGVDYPYTTSTIDLDDDQVYYMWDWGDGTFSEWTGPYHSGVEVTKSNSWSKGTYYVMVMAKDEHGLESEWSEPLSITMPRDKLQTNTLLMRILERFPNMFPLMRLLI